MESSTLIVGILILVALIFIIPAYILMQTSFKIVEKANLWSASILASAFALIASLVFLLTAAIIIIALIIIWSYRKIFFTKFFLLG